MQANLDREKFIELLETLGSEDDEQVLSAARDLHAQLTVAGLSWEDLLMPEPGDDDEVEDEDEVLDDEEDDIDADDVDDDEDDNGYEDDEEDGEDGEDEEDEEDDNPLSDEDKKEALSLIEQVLSSSVSKTTKEDMADFKADIKEGDFEQSDLRYLRALNNRLKK